MRGGWETCCLATGKRTTEKSESNARFEPTTSVTPGEHPTNYSSRETKTFKFPFI